MDVEKQMLEIDTELKLLSGESFEIPNVGILYPLTLREITKLSYSVYNYILNILCINSDYETIQNDKKLQSLASFGLSIFLKEPVNYKYKCLYVGELNECRYIDKNSYNLIIELLKKINCIDSNEGEDEEEFDPANEKARQIIAKAKLARKKIAKFKQDDDEQPLTFSNLISIFATNSNNININNVWDSTVYQFYNQFKRMQIYEQYKINIRSLLAGADPKDVKLENWMKCIK